MCKRLSLLNHKKTQYVEFFGTQMDSLAADIDDYFLKIHAQFRGVSILGSTSSEVERLSAGGSVTQVVHKRPNRGIRAIMYLTQTLPSCRFIACGARSYLKS